MKELSTEQIEDALDANELEQICGWTHFTKEQLKTNEVALRFLQKAMGEPSVTTINTGVERIKDFMFAEHCDDRHRLNEAFKAMCEQLVREVGDNN